MTTKPTGPLPIIATFDEILRKAKQSFVDTQRELARTARQKIDGEVKEKAHEERKTTR